MAAAAIDINNLTKRFRQVTAVDSLDLQIMAGEVYGLLGPNGAGKSTTVRCLIGSLNPTEGEVSVLGGKSRDPAVHARVGYTAGDVTFDRHLKVKDLLKWYGALRGGGYTTRAEELCERLALDPTRKIDELSTGNRRKVSIVQAFMHDPEVLIMDEPTAGLDPLLQRSVLELVAESRAEGAAILFSSHLLPEVENIADRVGILRVGKKIREDVIANLREVARQRIEVRFATEPPPGLFDEIDDITEVDHHDRVVHLVVSGSIDPVVKRLADHEVERIVTHDEDLEDIFFNYYRAEEDGR